MEGNITHLANSKPYYATQGAVICRVSGSFIRIVHHCGDDTMKAHRMADNLNAMTLRACLNAACFS